MCVVTVVELMVVGAGQRDGDGERERERGDGGGVCLFLLCYFAPPECTVGTKRRRERETMKA